MTASRIYLDHNATTPLHPRAAAILEQAISLESHARAHASSVHAEGRAARARLTRARRDIAEKLGAPDTHVCFVSSGSESCAMAIAGMLRARATPKRNTLLVSALEHPAVTLAAEQLSKSGIEVRTVAPMPNGQLTAEALAAAIDDSVFACTLQSVNHETGALQPVEAAAALCQSRDILFHTDAAQAVGKLPVRFLGPGTLLSFSAYKFGGPVGVGALIASPELPLLPLVPGHQEGGRRGGAIPVSLCEAAASALLAVTAEQETENRRLGVLRDDFEKAALDRFKGARRNGTAARIANTSNLCFPGIEADALLMALDLDGFAISTGAACASGSLKPSPTLRAMGLSLADARASIRVSLGRTTHPGDLTALLNALERRLPELGFGRYVV